MRKPGRIFALAVVLGVLGMAAGSTEVKATGDAEVTPPTTLNLWRPGDPGQALRISGWVRSIDGKPLAGATIRIRHADSSGLNYSAYQGTVETGKDGSYRFSTVLPGQYYGVRHIHIGAVYDGYEYFGTEILFKGDPNLDPESDTKLAIHLEEATVKAETVLFGRFDMSLRPLGGITK
jgi:protocatechuate 3,4-dioxygenase beta subunit